jgi:tungstate transport system ATP-binding protein
MSATVVEITEVRKAHASGFALEVERLQVHTGEVLCLLGPTGAGKSTLLSLLAAVSTPDRGTLRLDDQPLHGWQVPIENRRKVTMVFQRPLLLTGTVRRNVEFGLKLRRTRCTTVDAALARLGLATLSERRASSLSGGETQLVGLARALVISPSLLLLDEPTASLDPARVGLVERVIREVVADNGMAVVWATHNLFQARRVADRVALLLDGRIVEASSTAQFFDHPRNPRAADFVQGRFVC